MGCSVELATAGLAVGIAGSLIRDPVSNLGSLRQGVLPLEIRCQRGYATPARTNLVRRNLLIRI